MHAPAYPTAPPRLLSAETIRAEILKAFAERVTGQIQVVFQKEKSITLFVVRGKLVHFYIRNHRVVDPNWVSPLFEYGRGELSIEPLHPLGLMFKKIVVEKIGKVEVQPSDTSQLKIMFDLAEHNAGPTLFHIRWESAEGFVLVAGRDIPLRSAVMTNKTGSVEGLVAMNQITTWNEAGCKVAVYRDNIQSQAWLEVHLNILFNYYCSTILNQYGQLTGKVMVRSIAWKVHTMAMDRGWNIETQENKVRDATIFTSARKAGDVYKQVIAEVVAHIEPVIGHALTQNILTQSRNASKGVYKTIAEVFGLLGTGGTL
ncbi:MAG: hypothetical protein IPP66_22550 [Anaerolineales bacterium]|nr:hypothetical protein [Anaerolineales bacterium]